MDPLEEEAERVLQDFVDRRAAGERPMAEEVLERHPHLRELLTRRFATLEALDRLLERKGATPPQDTVLGDFRIIREVGRGGMGVVFQAEQLSLRRVVGLKVLGASLTRTWRTVERFRREAGIAARLRHPNIVSVYSVGESQGYYYYAMEFVDGVSLGQVLTRIRSKAPRRLAEVDLASVVRELMGPPGDDESGAVALRSQAWFGTVARLVADLADALVYAHSRGVIHRDVKPQNVLLNRRLVPQLTDFGLAKDMDLETLSQTGDLIGTPQYMSPELVMAGRIRVDHRTDIYSLGVTLYELLTLAVPFTGTSSQEVLRKILFDTPASPRRLQPEVPRDLQVIALRAMEKDPTHRYALVSELAEDLRRFLRFEPIQTRAPGPVIRMRRFVKRNRTRVAVGAGLLLVVLGTGMGFRVQGRAQRLRDGLSIARMQLERGNPLAARESFAGLMAALGPVEEVRSGLERATREVEELRLRHIRRAEDAERQAASWEGYRAVGVSELDAALVLRDDAALRARRDDLLGVHRVRILSDPPGARVSAREVLPKTGTLGPDLSLGETPLEPVPMHEGLHRIVFDKPGFGSGEYDLVVERGATDRVISVRLRRDDEAREGMALIPAGRYLLGHKREDLKPGDPRYELPPEVVELPAFYLDRYEVSNQAYLRFVQETGREAPPHWKSPGDPFPAEHASLPVTNVTWHDALAYSSWAGKRLPTSVEWEAACRGPNGSLYAWGNEFQPERPNYGPRLRLQLGLQAASPQSPLQAVDGPTQDRSPLGVLHLMGNVREWVWDPWPETPQPATARWSWREGSRTVRGRSVGEPQPNRAEMCTCAGRVPFNPLRRESNVGFRCAKSSRP